MTSSLRNILSEESDGDASILVGARRKKKNELNKQLYVAKMHASKWSGSQQQYEAMGDAAALVMATSDTKAIALLLYSNHRKVTLSSATLSPAFQLQVTTLNDVFACSFYDDQQASWSLQFSTFDGMVDFARHVTVFRALLCDNIGMGLHQDITSPAPSAELGEKIALSQTIELRVTKFNVDVLSGLNAASNTGENTAKLRVGSAASARSRPVSADVDKFLLGLCRSQRRLVIVKESGQIVLNDITILRIKKMKSAVVGDDLIQSDDSVSIVANDQASTSADKQALLNRVANIGRKLNIPGAAPVDFVTNGGLAEQHRMPEPQPQVVSASATPPPQLTQSTATVALYRNESPKQQVVENMNIADVATLSALFTETRQHNTEMRVQMMRLDDKVEDLVKFTTTANQVNRDAKYVDAKTLLNSIERICSDNAKLNETLREKDEQVETLSSRLQDAFRKNQQFISDSQQMLSQQTDGWKSVASDTQTQMLQLEKDRVEVNNRLARLVRENNELQLRVSEMVEQISVREQQVARQDHVLESLLGLRAEHEKCQQVVEEKDRLGKELIGLQTEYKALILSKHESDAESRRKSDEFDGKIKKFEELLNEKAETINRFEAVLNEVKRERDLRIGSMLSEQSAALQQQRSWFDAELLRVAADNADEKVTGETRLRERLAVELRNEFESGEMYDGEKVRRMISWALMNVREEDTGGVDEVVEATTATLLYENMEDDDDLSSVGGEYFSAMSNITTSSDDSGGSLRTMTPPSHEEDNDLADEPQTPVASKDPVTFVGDVQFEISPQVGLEVESGDGVGEIYKTEDYQTDEDLLNNQSPVGFELDSQIQLLEDEKINDKEDHIEIGIGEQQIMGEVEEALESPLTQPVRVSEVSVLDEEVEDEKVVSPDPESKSLSQNSLKSETISKPKSTLFDSDDDDDDFKTLFSKPTQIVHRNKLFDSSSSESDV